MRICLISIEITDENAQKSLAKFGNNGKMPPNNKYQISFSGGTPMMQDFIKKLEKLRIALLKRFKNHKEEAIEIFLILAIGHLFKLFNPNQVARTLGIDENKLYRQMDTWSIYKLRKMVIEFGCQKAIEEIKKLQGKSAATRSRYRVSLCIDDTVIDRYGKVISLTYSWYSGRWKKTVKGQNIISIVLKIGDLIIPLATRPVSKQGRGNTSKPKVFKNMLEEVIEAFNKQGINLSEFPISFDSWYGSIELVELLKDAGFDQILIHAKGNHVFTIDGVNQKLSEHKKEVELEDNQWGCKDIPVARKIAKSPTFGDLVLLFFEQLGKVQAVMCFGRALRSCEMISIWKQHHAVEQFWRSLKHDLGIAKMSLRDVQGVYLTIAIKVIAYLFLHVLAKCLKTTICQLQIKFQRSIHVCTFFQEHFHVPNARNSQFS
jgi:hypothetical protein